MALILSLVCFAAYAQQTVTGTVTDATGEPVIGATITIGGKAVGVTDFDGNFSIPDAKPSDVLEISYIGSKTQKITVGNKTSFNIKLEDDSQGLEELVVVGYGTVKKTDLTGSVSSVNTEQLNAKGASSVLGNLQGNNPGVNITQTTGRTNGDFSMEIRGKSSLNSSTTPLFIVDGVMCSDINFLNPQDIERIDILKDASSTAIYGSRATAGVVMVTTKGGLSVDKEQKATISYDGYYGWSKTARMPDFMDGQEFYDYRFMKFLTYAGNGATVGSANPVYQISGTVLEQCLLREHTGSGDYVMKKMLASGDTYDWPSLVTQNGSQQNHFLAVNGGSTNTHYHFGVGYNNEEGTYVGDGTQRINFKGSLDAKVNSVISAGFSINAANIRNKYANDDAIKFAYRMNPFMNPYDEDGNIVHQPGAYLALGTDSYQFSDQRNTLDIMKSTKKRRETWRLLGNVYLKLDIIKGLDFKTTFSPNYTYYREGFFGGYINPVTGNAYDDGTYTDGANEAKVVTSRGISWTWDNIINYRTKFGDDHELNLMGLYSMEHSDTEKINSAGTNVREGTDWWNITSGGFNLDDSGNSFTENSMTSWAFRVNYTFKGRYLLTATGRWDGCSKFSKDDRWGFFPSAALAWRINDEPFMKKVDWISNLKLRLSYGVTGNNAGIGNYDTQQTLGTTSYYYPFESNYMYGFAPSAIVNEILKWEKSKEWNLGLDFGFLRGRIYGSIDLYTKKSTDLLQEVKLPMETGYGKGGSLTTNIGSVRNTGVEIALTTVNIDSKDWRWETTFTFAHNKNKVKQIDGISDFLPVSDTQVFALGLPVYNIYTWENGGIVTDKDMIVPNIQLAIDNGFTPGEKVKEYDYYYKIYRLTEGQPYVIDQNNDGKIDNDDKIIMKSDPKWTGSFTSNLSYKNWDFSFSIYAKQGCKAYSPFIGEYLTLSDRGRVKLQEDWYIPAGTLLDCDGVNDDGTYINPKYQETTHYGSYPFPNNGGSSGGVGVQAAYWDAAKCVQNTSFVKVKNITLGYTFPKAWINKFGCNHLRLYFTVTNPFVFTKYDGFDPEWAGTALKNDGPSIINYQLGASIKF
ncbi:MAG: TonB-dependent receptor [Prevotella sp.]|nr:TonB-dependent receptor [Prevotella sp.]